MTFIRKGTFYFKEGKRDETVGELELILKKEARTAKGFQGYISMLSRDSENEAIILTMWDDELSFNTSALLLLQPVVREISNTLEKEPTFENLKLSSTEMFLGAHNEERNGA